MRRNVAFAISISALILLAGCSNPGGGPSGSPTATPSATAKATTLDPCLLVTAAEASALSGASFGAGLEETTGGTGKRCTYGAQTTNVFFVQVATAATASDAQTAWATEEAQADADLAAGFPAQASANVTKTDVSGLGDRAAVGTGSETIEGQTISGGVIYLLKGPNFLAFGDLTLATAPTAAALQAQAATSLDRMP